MQYSDSQLVGDRSVADDHLHHTGRVAQVDERDSPVIAATRHPAGEHDLDAAHLRRAACLLHECGSLRWLLGVHIGWLGNWAARRSRLHGDGAGDDRQVAGSTHAARQAPGRRCGCP